ncbi:MAG: hypothetical protein AAGD38_13990 [Acidobacteriota bacterium]
MLNLLSALLHPIPAEKRDLLAARWRSLPAELRTDRQLVGRQVVHCAYTLGASYCSFGCTHCYLPKTANRVPIPSFDEMKAQIDANRRFVGPLGGLQLTGGDLVDAYWRFGRADELVQIVRYANDAGTVPMLMTHGQVLLEHPDYFVRLVRDGGLRKIAIHIDITQAGRPGYPIKSLQSERDLSPLRDAFVDLIHDVVRRSRCRFAAAMTLTVTERNITSVGDVMRWLVADPRRLQAFRMISLQPEADVGRTRFSTEPVTPAHTWAEVGRGLGLTLPNDNLHFGDPACNAMTIVGIDTRTGDAVDLIPNDEQSRRVWNRMLDRFGGVGSWGERNGEAVLRRLSLLLRDPGLSVDLVRHVLARLRAADMWPGAIGSILRGRFRPLTVVMHNFMSEAEANSGSPEVERRLAACSFKGAVRRENGWEAVPMCAMNSREREGLYARAIASASEPSSTPSGKSSAINTVA